MGRFVKNPELKTTPQGAKVVNFSLAVTRQYRKNDGTTAKEVNYLDFEAWDSGAETITRHFTKGKPIIVHCSVKTESWTDTDGNKRSKLRFRVNSFEFVLGSKNEELPNDDSGDNNDGGFGGDAGNDVPF